MKKSVNEKKITSNLSAMLDDEASPRQIRKVLQELQGKRQDQSPSAIAEVWHGYYVIKNVLTTNADDNSASGLSSRFERSEDFLAGVWGGIARLDKAPRLTRRRSFNWLWNWGLQPLAAVASLALLVLIGVGVGADLMPANSGYASLNGSDPADQRVAGGVASTDASSLPTYVGKAVLANVQPNAQYRSVEAETVSTAEARPPAYFSARQGFVEEKLNAYKLDHANRKVNAGFAPFIRMVNYPDSRSYGREVSGVK